MRLSSGGAWRIQKIALRRRDGLVEEQAFPGREGYAVAVALALLFPPA